MEFNHNRDSASEEWGFSIKQLKELNSGTEQVPTIRLADWVTEHVAKRKLPQKLYGEYAPESGPKILMKMDIEGSEYVVLPDMITSGAMCELDFVFGELHPKFAPITFPETEDGAKTVRLRDRDEATEYGKSLLSVINNARNCKTTFKILDDETYLHDGMPLPGQEES